MYVCVHILYYIILCYIILYYIILYYIIYIYIYIYIYILCVCVCVCVCVLYRLQVVDTSPLRIRVKNDDVSMGGDVIGQITFPIEQIAMPGFEQKASGFS